MSKKTKRLIVLVTMMMFGAALLFAQESNTSKATFGELSNDGDDFLHSVNWKNIEFTNIFAFSRFGPNIADGWLDMGAAAKLGSTYLGLYYTGLVIGQNAGDSTSRTAYLSGDSDPVKLNSIRKGNQQATYGVLLGVGNTGVLLKYVDDLQVGDVTGLAPNAPGTESWNGTLTPSIELGGSFGPVSKVRFSMPIKYDRAEVTQVAGATATSFTATGSAAAAVAFDNAAAQALLAAEGNYLQPDLYLKFGSGSFTLENDLSLRIYGTPASKTGGKSGVQFGVGNVQTTWTTGASPVDQRLAVWDNRFYISDEIIPSYNFSGDVGKLTYSASAYLPIGLALTTHSLNAKSEGYPTNAEIKGIYKGADFDMAISPSLAAGVQFKPLDFFSLQGGINAEFFTWALEGRSTSKVDAPTGVNESALITASGVFASGKTSSATNTLTMPKLSFAAGFTFTFKEKAALDFVFVKVANPTAAGTIYKAVGDGLGSDETSVVLTVKF